MMLESESLEEQAVAEMCRHLVRAVSGVGAGERGGCERHVEKRRAATGLASEMALSWC